MANRSPIPFHQRFSVTVCQNPDYCVHCNELIKRDQIKVTSGSMVFHAGCAEQYHDHKIKVNTQRMRVEQNK